MNKISKYARIAFAGLVALTVAACTDDYTYDTPAALEGAQVYFSSTLPSQYEVSTTATSFNIPLNRQNTSGSVTVPLTFNADEGNIFNVPSEVTFADGDSVANITVTYDPSSIVYGNYVGGTIAFDASTYSTPFGATSYTFTAGNSPFSDMEANNSMGTYREDMMTTFYSVDNVVYSVKIQESTVTPGLYRLVNPYSANYDYNDPGDYDTSKDYYWEIDATDPNYVYFKQYDSEMAWSYGQFHMKSMVQYYLDGGNYTLDQLKEQAPDLFGKLENGIITMPVRSMLIGMDNYNNGAYYYANSNGLLAVALPGYQLKDYDLSAEFVSRTTNSVNADIANIDLTFGEDITTVKYKLVPYEYGLDVDSIADGMGAGTISATEVADTGVVSIPYESSGDYYLVVAGFENGEYVAHDSFGFTLWASHENYQTIASGTFLIGTNNISDEIFRTPRSYNFPYVIGAVENMTDTLSLEVAIQQSTDDPTHYRVTPYFTTGYDFNFTYDGNDVTVKNVDTGVKDGDGFSIVVNDFATMFGVTNSTLAQYNYHYNSFNPTTNTFTFALYYGGYTAETDELILTETAAKSLKAAVKRAKAHHKNFKNITKKNIKKQEVKNNRILKIAKPVKGL